MSATKLATGTDVMRWALDPAHTLVEFSAKHMMITTVKGGFAGVTGTIEGDLSDPATLEVNAEIDAASIETRSADRDKHLRSADFLDVEKHPTIGFRSTRLERAGENRYRLTGDLTIRGTTRPVTLEVTAEGHAKDPWGGERIGFTAQTKIDRRDFGLNWNAALETGGWLVSNEVRIELDVQAVLQQD